MKYHILSLSIVPIIVNIEKNHLLSLVIIVTNRNIISRGKYRFKQLSENNVPHMILKLGKMTHIGVILHHI